jgi:hypothetical protein
MYTYKYIYIRIKDVGVVEILKINPKMVQWDGSIGEGVELTVKSKLAVDEAYIGCSIAVNGIYICIYINIHIYK